MQLKAKQDKKNDGNERNRLQSENKCMLLYNSMLHSSFGPVWSSLLSQSFRKENSKIGGEARRWGKKMIKIVRIWCDPSLQPVEKMTKTYENC